MAISDLPNWFWPGLSFLLCILWLWTILQLRQATSASQAPVPKLVHQAVKAEDALKAAYTLQEAKDTWGGEELARAMGLSD